MTSKRERLEAAIAGEQADRPPVAFWRHFPVDDQDPTQLARAIADFQERFDFDFVKVTPASSFCLKDWGARDRWEGATEGTRTYTHRVIEAPEDWTQLAPLDPTAGHLGQQLRCLDELRERLGPDTPIVQTVFSPLSQAKNLAGRARLFEHLHRAPDQVDKGLESITDTVVAFVAAVMERAVDGIFYAVQHASFLYFDRDSYGRLQETNDRRILEAAGEMWLNVLHLHGEALMFDLAASYPASIVNWHDRLSGPGLAEAADQVPGAVCGGLRRHETMLLGAPLDVRREAADALEATAGRGMVLGAGCVVPTLTPAANLRAAHLAAEAFA